MNIRDLFHTQPHHDDDLLKRAALGAAAGLAGTIAMQFLRAATQKWLPAVEPPMREDPGKFMVHQAERALPESARRRVPGKAEAAAGAAMGMGYGMTFGALYAAARPAGGCAMAEGAALGVANWAAGFLGWLPAAGLMPPVWRQRPAQVAGPVVTHVLYGMATVAAYNLLNEKV